MPLSAPAIASAAALVSAVGVGLVRRYALRRAVLDLPNARSSHTVPTPRGGGLGVVVACLAVMVAAWGAAGGFTPARVAVLLGTAAVAWVGWLDDHRPLGVRPRLAVHALAGLAAAWLAAGLEGPLGVAGWAAAAWWVFWTVSSINVVNFMDGIDGIIGLQALVFGVHAVLLAGPAPDAAAAGAALAGAAAGFLAWNWAPARIFLGDVGSGALGMLMVVAGVLAQQASGRPTLVAFLPLFPLFLDAAVTLARRWRRGERLTEPHRSHLYQRLARDGWGHARVALLFGAAAAAGSVIAHVATPAVVPWAALAYFAGVAATGALLERRLASPHALTS